jgi:WD40 repeat protein
MQINKPVQLWQLMFEGDWTTSVAFLGNSRRIAAGNKSGQVFVWELPENPPEPDKAEKKEKPENSEPPNFAPVRRLDGHTNGITRLCAAPDGKTLISASLDHTIRIWDVDAPASGSEVVVIDQKARERKARNKGKEEKGMILNAPGTKVETVAATHILKGHDGWIFSLGISADGKRLISGDDSSLSIVWDLASRKEISRWRGHKHTWVRSAALSPDGKTAFTGEYGGKRDNFDIPAAQARLWNSDDGTLKLDLLKIWTPKVKDEARTDSYSYSTVWVKLLGRGLVCASFSPDGKVLAVGQGGEGGGKIHIVDVESGKILRTVDGHRLGACDVTFSADGKYVLSSGRDTTVRIWQVADGKEVAVLTKPLGAKYKDWMHGVAISPDQQTVAAADISGKVHVWKLQS